LAINVRRIPNLCATIDAGVNAFALPAISVASLVGFGAVVAAMPAFGVVREAVLGIGGGPLVSLAVATNTLAALTGSASGGLTIALDALGATYLARAVQIGMDPAILHRVAVIGSGTLDSLPHIRRGGDPVIRLRLNAQRQLQGHFHGRSPWRDHSARRRDCPRLSRGVVLD